MKKLAPIFSLLVVFWANCVFAQGRQNFEIVISGEIASKLEPGSSISAGTTGSGKVPPCGLTTTIEALPMQLPAKHFGGRWVQLTFGSPHPREKLFSILLSPDLFDKPRKINVRLAKPTPTIRPFWGGRELKYTPSITKRMSYRDLPNWDAKTERLVPAKSPPVLKMSDSTGNLILSQEMGDGCMGAKWFTRLKDVSANDKPHTFIFSVLYESGGLFEPIETNLRFEYDPELHGKPFP